jgi:hypothetical protein
MPAIDRDRAVLREVPGQPAGEAWIYQIGIPFQVGPTTAALCCNVRYASHPTVDFEAGNDLLLFDSLAALAPAGAQPLNRTGRETHPATGRPMWAVRYPLIGGFVPLASRGPDGAEHPHAGTGFAAGQVLGYPADREVKSRGFLTEEERYHRWEIQQYAWDGASFRVTETAAPAAGDLLAGWELTSPGLSYTLPAGEDLLMGFAGNRPGAERCSGVLRWRRRGGAWRPVAFVPVTPADGSFESTLVRDAAGALVFTARGRDAAANSVRLWRSEDEGETWRLTLTAEGVRARTPVSLNRAADGRLYVAGNPHRMRDSLGNELRSIEMREQLLLWPVAAGGGALEAPRPVRDCPAEWGPAPGGSIWRADHPLGRTVRLADDREHHLLCYRVMSKHECVGDAPPTARTGLYVNELRSL